MLMESRLKILEGVRGNSDAISSQQGEKVSDPEHSATASWDFCFFFFFLLCFFFAL